MLQALARMIGFGAVSPAPAPAPEKRAEQCPLTGIALENLEYLRRAVEPSITLSGEKYHLVFGVDSQGRIRSGPSLSLPNGRALFELTVTTFMFESGRYSFRIPPELGAEAREQLSQALRFRYEREPGGHPSKLEFYEVHGDERIVLNAETLAPKGQAIAQSSVREVPSIIDYVESAGFDLLEQGKSIRSLAVMPVDAFIMRAGTEKPRDLSDVAFVLCEREPIPGRPPFSGYIPLDVDTAIEISGKSERGAAIGVHPDGKMTLTFTQDFQIVASFKGAGGQELSMLKKV